MYKDHDSQSPAVVWCGGLQRLLVVCEVKLSSAKCPQVVCVLVVGGGCTLESAGPHQWPLT